MSTSPETLYIMDGSAYIFRAFYANPNLTTSTGFPTSALMGFASMLRKLIRDKRPDHLAVAFDVSKTTFRTELYDQYKANRSNPPDELLQQIPRVQELVRAMNIPVLAMNGFEADDLIATMVKRALQVKNLDVVICSADKDLMQLIGPRVTMYDAMRDRVFKTDNVVERFQVPPDKVAQVMALAGDSSDNVPGVPGIGEKTAGKLIKEFGDLDTLLNSIDKVSGKKRKENLTNFADQARLSLELVTLRDDLKIDFELKDLKLSDPNYPELEKLYREFEFKRFLAELARDQAQGAPEATTSLQQHKTETTTILDEAQLDDALAACADAGLFAFDLETTSVDPLKAEIVGFALAWQDNAGVYIPVGHRALGTPKQLALDAVMAKLAPLLSSTEIKKIAHHAKYEWIILHRHGVPFNGVVCDTMLASYLLDPARRSHSLDNLARDVLGKTTIAYTDVAGKGRKQVTFDMVPLDIAAPYAAEDADVTRLLYKALWPRLEEASLVDLHDTMEMPLSRVLAIMEMNGIRIDTDTLQKLSTDFQAELDQIEKRAFEAAGKEFNLNSPVQLRQILFEELELPVKKRTKSGPSTDQSVLEALKGKHPLPGIILEHRTIAKLKSTYIDALPELMHEDGRVHTDFNQAVTATGRLSSSNPNLQNIPVRTARGREIRRAFIPAEGHTLLAADYSQIELRLLAHLSGDKALVEAFKSGEDIHRRTAAEIFDLPPLFVTPDHRRTGKCVHPDTLIFANDALTPIGALNDCPEDQFQPLDEVWTHDGAGRPIKVNASYNGGTKPLYHVVTRRGVVTCTARHAFVTSRGDLACIHDGSLQAGVELKTPHIPSLTDHPYDALLSHAEPPLDATSPTPSNALAWLYGLLVAHNGDVEQGPVISIPTPEGSPERAETDPHAQWRHVVCQEARWLGFHPENHPEGVTLHPSDHSPDLAALHAMNDGHAHGEPSGAAAPHIPQWILKSGRTALHHFLGGLIDADGAVDASGALTFDTAHATFAGQLAAACLTTNLPVEVETTWDEARRRFDFRLTLSNDATNALRHTLRRPDRRARLDEFAPSDALDAGEAAAPVPNTVLQIIAAGQGPCVDLNVDSQDHLYLTNGLITHNTLNFGIIYGMGAGRLARDLEIKRAEASEYIERYFERYKGVSDYFDELIDKTRTTGFATTMFGRRRPIPEVLSPRGNIQALGERLAQNTPIQGSAADLIKIAMIRIQERIESEAWPARMLLQVHDELVFEVQDDRLTDFTALVVEEMTDVTRLRVPLVVDTGKGQSWLEAK